MINGGNRTQNVQFGGHRFAQEWFRNNVLQLVNNVYYNTDAVKYTFGIDYMYTRARSVYGSEVNGRFHYDGFQNFIDNRPFRYCGSAAHALTQAVTSNIHNIGLYGQMQTRLGKGLDVAAAGLRFDYAIYPNSPFNQLVYDELKIRTDNKLRSFIAQPRVQFTWDVNYRNTKIISDSALVSSLPISTITWSSTTSYLMVNTSLLLM